MSRWQRWALITVVVVLAAFVSGLLRGITGSVPAELAPAPHSPAASPNG